MKHRVTCILLLVSSQLLCPMLYADETASNTPDSNKASPETLDALSDTLTYEPMNSISAEGVASGLAKKSLVLLDVRSREAFDKAHIKWAVNLPLTEMTQDTLEQMIPDKESHIVVYCDYQLAPVRQIALSRLGEPVLFKAGYKNLNQLETLWQRKDLGMNALATLSKKGVLGIEGKDKSQFIP